MIPPPSPTSALLSELLLLPDGSVLADKLTPAMAALLTSIGLKPHAATQAQLGSHKPAVVKPGDRLEATGFVEVNASTQVTTTNEIEGTP